MPAEIIPPGSGERDLRRLMRRRRLLFWVAIVLGLAAAVGLIAVGFIVVAIAAVVGVAAWIVFALLRLIGRPDGTSPSDRSRPGPMAGRIEIITTRGETLDGGVATELPDDGARPRGDRRDPPHRG